MALGPMLDVVATERGTLDGFDVAFPACPGSDMEAFERAGATWALWHFYPPAPADDIMKAVSAAPAAHVRLARHWRVAVPRCQGQRTVWRCMYGKERDHPIAHFHAGCRASVLAGTN